MIVYLSKLPVVETIQPLPKQTRTYWFSKFTECVLAILAAGSLVAMISEMLPEKWQSGTSQQVFYFIYKWTPVVALIVSLLYSIYWHRKEKKGTIRSGVRHAWLQALIRYWLALEIATYGFAKILGTQFGQSYHRNDTLVGDLNGFNLTWNYFAYSYPMTVIIAFVQIIGAALLLFRRTTLLGVTILLPVMLNIFLINIFYSIAEGALINSVMFSLGLIYLLSRYWAPLKKVYLNSISSLPAIKMRFWKIVLKVVCIAAAFGIIYSYTLQDEHSPLEGKWRVVSLRKNGIMVQAGAWQTDSAAWSNLYFEAYGRAVFCANPYVFENDRATWLKYKVDTLKKTITFDRKISDKLRDTAVAKILTWSAREVEWRAYFGADTFLVKMQPAPKRNHS